MQMFEFKQPFEIVYDNGVISFVDVDGNKVVEIDTGLPGDYDDEEEEV